MSKTTNKFSPEVRERAVRMVSEHRAHSRNGMRTHGGWPRGRPCSGRSGARG